MAATKTPETSKKPETKTPKKTAIPPELKRKLKENKGILRDGDAKGIEGEERSIELSFASDRYVEDWPGFFIRLSHEDGDYNFDRLNSGGPLLMDHNRRDQVAAIQEAYVAEVDGGKRSRAKAKFSRSSRGTEIYNDVIDGIRTKTSCRFDIDSLVLDEETEDGARYYTATWTAFEASIVSIPADDSVGVGRSQWDDEEGGKTAKDLLDSSTEDAGVQSQTRNDEVNPMPESTKKNEKPDSEDGKKPVVPGGQRSEEPKVSEHDRILDAAEMYDADQAAAEYLRSAKRENKSPTLEEFQAKLLKDGGTSASVGERGASANGDDENPEIGMDSKQIENYSFVRAINAMVNPSNARIQREAKLELECSEAVERKMNKTPEGLFIPYDVLSADRAISVGGTGGNLVATDLQSGSFIELLRKKSALMGLVTPMNGLVGDVDIPSQESAATGGWLGEDDESGTSDSTLGNRILTPKTVTANTEVTRKMLKQSSKDMEGLVRDDLAKVLALSIDNAGLYGSGTANQPLGVANMTGVNQVDFAGLNPTWGEVVDMESEVAADDADAEGMQYLFGARMKGHLTQTEKIAGSGKEIIAADGTVNGYSYRKTNQVLINEMFFGNWKDLLLAMWGALDVNVDPYTHSKRGKIIVIAFQDVDWVARHVESFSHGKQFTP